MELEPHQYITKKQTKRPISLIIVNKTSNELEVGQTNPLPFTKTIPSNSFDHENYGFLKPTAPNNDSLFALFYKEKNSKNFFIIRLYIASKENNFADYQAQVTDLKGNTIVAQTPVRTFLKRPHQFYNIIVEIKGNEMNNFAGTTIIASISDQKL